MNVRLTDAEYAQLSIAEQGQYWRRRYYDLENERDRLDGEVRYLRGVVSQIHDITNGHNWVRG